MTYIPKVENKNLANIYRKSRVLLNPTSYEIFGMTVLEAMYFGVPVIVSAEAGPKEIINNGVDGILLEGFKLDTWKNAVINLLDNEKMRYEMGRCAKNKVQREFCGHLMPRSLRMRMHLYVGKKRGNRHNIYFEQKLQCGSIN